MPSSASASAPANSLVSAKNLRYSYPSGVSALSGISLEIGPEERVGLVGPSGAGKSTLLLHLNGLLPETGSSRQNSPISSVVINGLEMQPSNLSAIRQQVGLLFQNPDDQLFCPTVEEDVAFGPRQMNLSVPECESRVTSALEQVGLLDLRTRPVSQLSYGQKKRACLAGLFACRPGILALDEPFTGLDPRARNSLMDLLRSFPGAIFTATHDLDIVIRMCDRVLLLDQGVLRAAGPTSKILGDALLMEKHGLEVPLRLQSDQETSPAKSKTTGPEGP